MEQALVAADRMRDNLVKRVYKQDIAETLTYDAARAALGAKGAG
jgi:hypothetical protein